MTEHEIQNLKLVSPIVLTSSLLSLHHPYFIELRDKHQKWRGEGERAFVEEQPASGTG